MNEADAQVVEQRLHRLGKLIESALEAETTRDITTYAGYAQAAAVELQEFLRARIDDGAFEDHRIPAVQSGADLLSQAAETAQKVGLGTDAPSMHQRVLDFKADLDRAISQVQRAMSYEK
jgi:hypothetical protein